jgi:hypothetical protein
MKIEHALLSDLIKSVRKAGYRVMVETDGLYNYDNQETVWLETRHVPRSWGGSGDLALSCRKPGAKTWYSVSINWFTGNIGIEKV